MENYTIQVLGISPDGPAGILGPGQQGTVTVYFQSVAGDNQFTVAANTTADTSPVDYSILSHGAQPGLLLRTPSGTRSSRTSSRRSARPRATTSQMLDQNATLLPPALGNNALATDLAELQIDPCRGRHRPIDHRHPPDHRPPARAGRSDGLCHERDDG